MKDAQVRKVALVHGCDRYIFRYAPTRQSEAIAVALRWANDPGLSFCLVDAIAVAQAIREQAAHNDLPGAA